MTREPNARARPVRSVANRASKSSLTSTSNFAEASTSITRAVGARVVCRKRRNASRAPVPSPASSSSAGIPHAATIERATSSRRATSPAGGSAPTRCGTQSVRGAPAGPSCQPEEVLGTNIVLPAIARRPVSTSPVAPESGTGITRPTCAETSSRVRASSHPAREADTLARAKGDLPLQGASGAQPMRKCNMESEPVSTMAVPSGPANVTSYRHAAGSTPP